MDFSWTEEQEIWRRTVREFAQKKIKPRVREIDTNKKIPDEIIKDMARLGLLAPTVSKFPSMFPDSFATSNWTSDKLLLLVKTKVAPS